MAARCLFEAISADHSTVVGRGGAHGGCHSSGVEELTLRANGLRFHLLADGPHDAPLVLLLHGFPELARSWRHQLPALAAAGYRAVAPDQRGYGGTELRGPYDTRTLATDVACLVRALGHEQATVVGHDWGGGVAWTFAHAYPNLLDRLAVLNCPPPSVLMTELRTNRRQLRRSRYMLVFQLPLLPEWLLTRDGARQVERALVAGAHVHDAWTDEELAVYRAALLRPGRAKAAIDWYRGAFRRPLRAGRLASRSPITAPTIIIWGVHDRFLGRELIEPAKLRRVFAPGNEPEIVLVDEAGHFVQNEAPTRVNDELIRWLRSDEMKTLALLAAAAWLTGSPLPEPRTEVSAAPLRGEIVVVGGFLASGGNSRRVDAYRPATDSWRRLPDLPVSVDHAAVASSRGRVVIIGGYGADRRLLRTAFAWDGTRWRTLPRPPEERAAAAAAATSDGRVWVVGGRTAGGDRLATRMLVLDLKTLRWTSVPGPAPREHLAAAALGGRIYALGGRAAGIDTNVSTVQAYDPQARRWATLPPLPDTRGGTGAAAVGGRVISIGGEEPQGTIAEVYAYDPRTRRWASLPNLPTPRHGLGVAALAGRVWVVGGGPQPGLTVSGAVESLPLP